ncbi:MAG: FAD-dependent monooxygenase [Bacteroidota bacterium]
MKVLILGAGPAGSSCAISLLQAGCHNVTILDRSEFPRHAPGETLHPGIEVLLQQLGVWEEVLRLCEIRQKGVEVIRYQVHEKNYYNKEASWKGLQVIREYLDQILLKRAEKLGAKVMLGEKAIKLDHQDHFINSIQAGKTQLEADYFVDAGGRVRWISRQLGISSERYGERLIAHYGYYQDDQPLEMPIIAYNKKDGSWLWQAQIGKETFNPTLFIRIVKRRT